MSENNFCIEEEVPDHHFRTEIPNIIFEMLHQKKIDHYDFVVYTVIKRIAGDGGKCFYSIPKLAERCGISADKTRKCIKKLNTYIDGFSSLISVIQRCESGTSLTHVITVRNIWSLNGVFFRTRENTEIKKVFTGSCQRGGGSWERDKEEPLKKNQKKLTNVSKEKSVSQFPATPNATLKKEAVASESLSPEEKKKLLSRKFNAVVDGNPTQLHLSEEQVNFISREYSVDQINWCGRNLINARKSKRRRLEPIENELGYFIESLRRHKSGEWK